jgi:hypothetical protein
MKPTPVINLVDNISQENDEKSFDDFTIDEKKNIDFFGNINIETLKDQKESEGTEKSEIYEIKGDISENIQKEIENFEKMEYEIKGDINKNDKKETNINTKDIIKSTNETENNNKYKDKEISINKKRRRTSNTNNNSEYEPKKMRVKCKQILLEAIMNFINQKIKEKYNFEIGKGICENQLKKLNQKQNSTTDVDFNKEFINKPIKDIFSDNISKKFTTYLETHNKNIINNLLNEKDLNKRDYFTKLFSLTFLDCLKYFRGEVYFDELKGMHSLDDEIENNFGKDEYIEQVKHYFNNYEKIIEKLRHRDRIKKA